MSLRGGADAAAIERALRKGTRRLRRADLSDFSGENATLAAVDAFIHTVAGRRLPAPAKAAIEMAVFDLAGKASERPLWSLLGAETAEPVICNATLVARRARGRRRRRRALGRARLRDLQAQARHGRRRRAGSGRARAPRPRSPHPRRRQRRLGRRRGARDPAADRAAGNRTRRAARCRHPRHGCSDRRDQRPGRRRRVGRASQGRHRRQARRGLRPDHREAEQGRRDRRGERDRGRAADATSRVRSTVRSASQRPHMLRRCCRQAAPPTGSPRASRPSCCSPRRSPAGRARSTAPNSCFPTDRASASSSTRTRSPRTGSSADHPRWGIDATSGLVEAPGRCVVGRSRRRAW